MGQLVDGHRCVICVYRSTGVVVVVVVVKNERITGTSLRAVNLIELAQSFLFKSHDKLEAQLVDFPSCVPSDSFSVTPLASQGNDVHHSSPSQRQVRLIHLLGKYRKLGTFSRWRVLISHPGHI